METTINRNGSTKFSGFQQFFKVVSETTTGQNDLATLKIRTLLTAQVNYVQQQLPITAEPECLSVTQPNFIFAGKSGANSSDGAPL